MSGAQALATAGILAAVSSFLGPLVIGAGPALSCAGGVMLVGNITALVLERKRKAS